MTTQLTEAQRRIQLYKADFPLFASSCLKILNKAGNLVPFVFNEPQKIVHAALEKQRREKGFVRAIVLKARKQGISTYIQARNYHHTTLWPHRSCYILAHEQEASSAIFDIVDRLQENNPLKPQIGTSNVKELSFSKLKSSYTVATAGSKGTGRGQTNHYYHGSEVAFWPNDKEHFKASVQTVPLEPNTEIILESTANGPSGEFYNRWQDAERGIGDYIAIFIPWYASPEYSREPEPGFMLRNDADDGELSEVEYAQLYGLNDAQMCWRRYKIQELGGHNAFRQENPATAAEAFVSADQASYIPPVDVLRARKRKVIGGGPLIMGVDPAGAGGDRFAVAFRRGHRVEEVLRRNKLDAPAALAWLRSLIEERWPDKVFVDQGGLGAPIIQMLKTVSPHFAAIVEGVNFGVPSQHKNARPKVAGPKRRRDEMWMRSKDWLAQEDGVQIPDDDALQSDATSVWVKNDINNDLVLSTKEEMKAKGIRSPDLWDAVVLTFASSVYVSSPTPTQGMPIAAVPEPSYSGSVPLSPLAGHPTGWMG